MKTKEAIKQLCPAPRDALQTWKDVLLQFTWKTCHFQMFTKIGFNRESIWF